MKELLKKIDLFYSLAGAKENNFPFNLAASVVTPEIASGAKVLANKLASSDAADSLTVEIKSLEGAAQGDDLGTLKRTIQAAAAETAYHSGSPYIDAVTLLTQVNRVLNLQKAKRN